MSWPDILRMVDQDPRVIASRHQISAARSEVETAGAIPNPSLEMSSAYGEAVDKSAWKVEWGVGVAMPLTWLLQRGAQLDLASARVRLADSQARELRRQVVLQLRLLFWQLVYQQELVASLMEQSEQTQALAKTVLLRVEQGDVRPVEATRIQAELGKVLGELEVARALLQAQRVQLATWLGLPKQFYALAQLEDLPQPPSAQRAKEQVRVEHPSVLAQEAKIQELTSQVAVEEWSRVPPVEISAFAEHELDKQAYGVSLSLDLPFWNWNSGAIGKAQADLAAGKQLQSAHHLELEASVAKTHTACLAGAALAERYRRDILPNITSAASTIERTYQLGEVTLLEVIDARRTLLSTKQQYLDALGQTQQDCSLLYALLGEEMP